MRLIDADALLEIIRRDWSLFQGATYIGDQARRDELTNVIAEIINAPTIDLVKHGRWENSEYAGVDYYQCNLCGHAVTMAYNYCPACGARMGGTEDE